MDVVTLQARLDAITQARDSGVLSVRHGDTQTNFRTLADMNQVIGNLQRQIAAQAPTPKRRGPRYIYQISRGYGWYGWF